MIDVSMSILQVVIAILSTDIFAHTAVVKSTSSATWQVMITIVVDPIATVVTTTKNKTSYHQTFGWVLNHSK